MSSKQDRNAHKPSFNAPNPGKFLKEMEALIPQLKAKGVIPMSREEARAMGEKGTKAAAMKADAEHKRRTEILGRRLDEYIKGLAPWTFKLVFLTGWTWLIPFMGYSYKMEATKETVEGCPNIACTRVYIYRRICWPFRPRVVKAERLVWEEPKPPKTPPPPKSRIIRP